MSLGMIVKAPDGLVLAAESRLTLGAITPDHRQFVVNFDNATKLLSFTKAPAIGAVTYGQALIGMRAAHSYIPEFELTLGEARLPVDEFASRLAHFFAEQWARAGMATDPTSPQMTFVVGGFNEQEAYGRVFLVDVPGALEPVERSPGENFGITWGGQRDVVDRLLQGYAPELLDILAGAGVAADKIEEIRVALSQLQMKIPIQAMALQDCVELAIFFIRTTIAAQSLTVGIRGVGGPIDIATITQSGGLSFVQQKRIVGEQPNRAYGDLRR